MHRLRWLVVSAFAACLTCSDTRARHEPEAAQARHVILFIGDGMGFEQVRAAGMFANGDGGTLSFEALPHTSSITTDNATGGITDSAAAATAMATGVKVANGVLSVAIPGSGARLTTVLEHARAHGMATGLVTTTYISHATPAAFGAHAVQRTQNDEIVAQYLADSRPDLLLGGGAYVTPEAAEQAGYAVVSHSAGLASLDPLAVQRVWGQFGEDHLPYELDGAGDLPHLSDMTRAALSLLGRDDGAFFLMVEGGRIDHAGHANDIERSVRETVAFGDAVSVVLTWAQEHEDALIVVTADHETGGLELVANRGVGLAPEVSWTTQGHTARRVPLYAVGPGSDYCAEDAQNTCIFDMLVRTLPDS